MFQCFACKRRGEENLFRQSSNLETHLENRHSIEERNQHLRDVNRFGSLVSKHDDSSSGGRTGSGKKDSSLNLFNLASFMDEDLDHGNNSNHGVHLELQEGNPLNNGSASEDEGNPPLQDDNSINNDSEYDNESSETTAVPTLKPPVIVWTMDPELDNEKEDSQSSSSSSSSETPVVLEQPTPIGRVTRALAMRHLANQEEVTPKKPPTPAYTQESFLAALDTEDTPTRNDIPFNVPLANVPRPQQTEEANLARDADDPSFLSFISEKFREELQAHPNLKVNYDLFQKMESMFQSGFLHADLSKKEQHQLRLLQMCTNANVPNFLYDEIIQWAQDAHDDGCFGSDQSPFKKREKFIHIMSKRVGMDSAVPRKSIVELDHAGIKLVITYFDALEAILSLLNDPELMKKENLNFLPNPDGEGEPNGIFPEALFQEPKMDGSHLNGDFILGDINTGCLAQVVHTERVQIKGREAFIPIIFFIDKTHIDRHGRLCQEPICFTLGIFNQKTRANPLAWRELGGVPNSSMHITAKAPVDKLRDYHKIIHHIMVKSGMSALMDGSGIYWKFPETVTLGNTEGLLHLYFSNLTGDTSCLPQPSKRTLQCWYSQCSMSLSNVQYPIRPD